MAKFTVTGDQHFGITGQMLEIQRQIRLRGGSPIDPELVALALQDVVEGKFPRTSKKNNSILRLISKGESIIIETCDGSQTLVNAKEVFKSGIDPDLNHWSFKQAGPSKEKTLVQVYEMAQDATFAQMFGSLGTDLDKLCFTQHQIILFCEVHKEWLSKHGNGTYFLFKAEYQFFIVYVRVPSTGLFIDINRFGRDSIWDAKSAHRVVVPQLIK